MDEATRQRLKCQALSDQVWASLVPLQEDIHRIAYGGVDVNSEFDMILIQKIFSLVLGDLITKNSD